MNWNDLASIELPSITIYPTVSSTSLKSQLSTNDVASTSLDGTVEMPQLKQTHDNSFGPPIEKLEDLITRYEHNLFSLVIERADDEIRQKTTNAIEEQLQQLWDQERAPFTKNTLGERIEKRTPQWSDVSPFNSTYVNVAIIAKPDPTFIIDHWAIVERMRLHSTTTDYIELFSRIASEASGQKNFPTSMTAYESAWQLLNNFVGVSNSPVDQAKAILTHFCKQFQVNVTNRVRKASLAGQDTNSTYINDLAAQCEVFTRLTIGSADPWAVCFYCLRCGDANAALQTLEQIRPSPDEAVRRLLVTMARTQANSSCIWYGSILRLDPSDRQVVSEILDAEDDRAVSKRNVHKKAVLTLLSDNTSWPFDFETTEGFQTIEDYLTGALWVAVSQSNSVDQIIHVGEEILKLGPSYFDDPSSGGWSFALPLLATQQYQKALLWLSKSGGQLGLLQAAHIGLVLSFAGTKIRNLGQTDSIGDGTIIDLLLAYATEIRKEHGPLAALDYLAQIPSKTRACKEVSNLIVTMDDMTTMVGSLNSEGIRHGGVISKHFTVDQLSSILIEASNQLSLSVGDQQKLGKAVMCMMLAEQYDGALSMLNRLIAPPNTIDDSRCFWKEQVSLFHQHYINSPTHVREVIERSGRTSLIHTSRLLMELNLFFDLLRAGNNLSECLIIAQKTQLLPSTEADLKIKESEYRDLDPLVQDSIPFLMIGVMELLSGDYTNTKRHIHRDTSGVVRERLNELKENARLLTSFASRLRIANYHIGVLTHLMSLMI